MSRVRAVLLVAAVSALAPSAARAAESPTAEQARRAAEVRKKLAATATFGGFDDPETHLDDVFQYLTRIGGVKFEINDQAFMDEMLDNVREKTIGKPLPKMADVSVETALRRVLARIPAPSGTTFVVRGGVVEITTRRYLSPAAWHRHEEATADEAGGPGVVFPPETSIAFEKRELREALQEIADATGVNIVVDGRAQDKGKTPITVTLQNVAVDTAIRLLADTADLQAVLVDDVFYVTTKENVQVLRKEQEKKRHAPALAGTGAAQPAPAGLPAEAQRLLKERDEEIRRLKEKLKDKQQPEPGPLRND